MPAAVASASCLVRQEDTVDHVDHPVGRHDVSADDLGPTDGQGVARVEKELRLRVGESEPVRYEIAVVACDA